MEIACQVLARHTDAERLETEVGKEEGTVGTTTETHENFVKPKDTNSKKHGRRQETHRE